MHASPAGHDNVNRRCACPTKTESYVNIMPTDISGDYIEDPLVIGGRMC